MLQQVNVRTKTTNFEYVVTHNNPGYLTYWRLTWNLFQQMLTLNNINSVIGMPFANQFKMWILFVVKLPWWTMIKPLGWIFSSKTTYKASFFEELRNDQVKKSVFTNQSKIKLFFVSTIPVWITWGAFNKNDLDLLTQKYTMKNH